MKVKDLYKKIKSHEELLRQHQEIQQIMSRIGFYLDNFSVNNEITQHAYLSVTSTIPNHLLRKYLDLRDPIDQANAKHIPFEPGFYSRSEAF